MITSSRMEADSRLNNDAMKGEGTVNDSAHQIAASQAACTHVYFYCEYLPFMPHTALLFLSIINLFMKI